MKVRYSANNSGGSWWLKDKDWAALEAAGWEVKWKRDDPYYARKGMLDAGRWLGALATDASKDFPTVKDAIQEFERITGQSATDEGCNCCGAPHTFYWGCAIDTETCGCPEKTPHKDYGYASGEGLIPVLYGDDAPRSLREALDR